jgi:uncharacterized protein YdiU (UPF0061 family)
MPPLFPFDTTYTRLPDRLYAPVRPTPVARPAIVRVNRPLAALLGVDVARLESDEGAAALAGNAVPEGAASIALAYAGHQFGGLVPSLGDGRALLLGEVVGTDGARRDVQLKGSGPTPWSRGGDGRAALGPVLREYVVAEAMAAIGVPTTRALAAVTTGERVMREEPLPGAVLTRVAASHLRVGTFEYAAIRRDVEALRALVDHALERHDPAGLAAPNRALALLEGVVRRQASLVAKWLSVGFVHGVMNTDNTTISGETIDYGPCAFLDEYDPRAVWSSIDRAGRYAYGNQPRILAWNLARLAEALLPVLADEEGAAVELATPVVRSFGALFERAYHAAMRAKIGLVTEEEGDVALVDDLLGAMAAERADFTNTFRRLADAALGADHEAPVRAELGDGGAWDSWAPRWRERLGREPGTPEERSARLRATNPAVIPRNHLVEAAIRAAVDRADFAPFHALVEATTRPFEDAGPAFTTPPEDAERVTRTFCGT